MDKSTTGSTWIVLFTVSFKFGPRTLNGLSGSPRTSALTSIVMFALVFAGMSFTIHVRFWVVLSKLITVKPVVLITLMNSSPSGNLSIKVKVSFQSSSPIFSTER